MSDVVAGEGSEYSCSLRCSNKPAIVTFLHDVHNVSLAQLNLVLILRLVVVKSPEPCNGLSVITNHDKYHNSYGVGSGFPLDSDDPGLESVEYGLADPPMIIGFCFS